MTIILIALSGVLAACQRAARPLPRSLYYMDGPEGEAQVWRLEPDGLSKSQITNEEAGVDAFSVSPRDGAIAFVTNNELFLQGGDGRNRRLVVDGNQVDKGVEDYVFRGIVSDPSLSPDGQTLAYGFDGLHLYKVLSPKDEHVLTNLGNLLGETFVFAKEAYVPWAWSPDASKLLIIMSYYEGSTLAVMEPGAEERFTRLRSNGPVCCIYNWAVDGRSVLVANPSYNGDIPGLWEYDGATGKETVIVPGLGEDGSLNYVGWPLQLASGDLVFFHVNMARFSPDVGIPLEMVRSHWDGSNLTQLRSEQFHIAEALWAQDGSLAVVLQRSSAGGRQVVLAPADGSPTQVLIEHGDEIRDLAWGP